MHGFEDPVVSFAQRTRIELLERLPEHLLVLLHRQELAHFRDRVLEHISQATRPCRRLCRILRDILDDGPHIQTRAPIHVPHIRQQHVRLMGTHQSVVTRKLHIPLALAIPLRDARTANLVPIQQRQRETVTAKRTPRLPPRAWMLPY